MSQILPLLSGCHRQIPEMKYHLPLNLVIYISTSCSCLSQRIYTRFSFTLRNTTSSFMLVTELQHNCKKNSLTKLCQLVFSFQMFICGWASSCKWPFNSNIPSWPQMRTILTGQWPAPVRNTFFASQGCPLMRASTVDCGLLLPANHLVVFVNRDVRNVNVIIRTKVTVRGTKPFIKPMLQRQKLWLVPKMPVSII